MSTYKLVCPHCASRMRIRTSDGKHIFLRVAYLQCTNEACGWSVRAEFEMTHEMSPSGMPNPSVRLPSAPTSLRRDAMRQQGDNQLDLLEAHRMNVFPLSQQQADDYRTSMQQAARRFIAGHAGEHLDDDGLFERTVCYLVNALDVPAFMADRLALLAMSERLPKGVAWIAVDMAIGPDRGQLLVLDRRTGLQTPLPCRVLPHRFLAAPAAR